jgi:hypothetical protein
MLLDIQTVRVRGRRLQVIILICTILLLTVVISTEELLCQDEQTQPLAQQIWADQLPHPSAAWFVILAKISMTHS